MAIYDKIYSYYSKKRPIQKHQEILTNISKFNLTRVLLIMNVKYTN